ncbi:hypothetical protein FACS1894125_7150 [Actinomycetota bacterium]|nr:hypothetical protein FACS1894125_7150 [Actinomycetota bacterium]
MSVDIPYAFVFTDSADDDFVEVLSHYAEYGLRTAERFDSAVETTKELLSMFPYAAHKYDEKLDVYYCSIPKYPYALYMRIEDNEFAVIAFALVPERQNPQNIKKLITKRVQDLELRKTKEASSYEN